jgi:Putative zinc-finger
MTPWHTDDGILAAYAEGRLDRARSASVEQHLTGCAHCRAAVQPYADEAVLRQVWADTVDTLDRPRVSPFERVLIWCGLPASSARLAAGASAARRAWVIGCAVVAVYAVLGRGLDGRTAIWFLSVAPLVPLTGVAVAYGPGSFPMHDVVVAAPYSELKLVLLRCLPVLPMTGLVLLAGSLILPNSVTAVLWLLPGLALAALSLAAERYLGAAWSIAILALLWMGFVAGSRYSTGSALSAFAPAVQVLSFLIVLTAAAAAILITRRARRLL